MKPLIVLAALTLGAVGARAAPADPDHFQASYDREAAGDSRGALEALDKLSPSSKQTYVYHLRTGWLLHVSGEHRASIDAYRAAVRLEPKAPEPRLGLTLPLMALRLWKDALGVTEAILKRDPKSYLARSRRALCLYSLGRYDKAEAAYRDVVSDSPADPEMRTGLAWAVLQQGKRDAALAEAERVLAVAPRHPSALQAKAQLGATP